MFNNAYGAQDAQKPPLLHPHDPSVEKEYEILIQAWKDQLIDDTPPAPSNDYIRLAWMRLMDHYLDQQWLDSKQMLQCAQAWSARESISLTEAVHTMNVLSLKSMQRSLDARQELLQALGDPDFMLGFGVAPINTHTDEHSSLAGSEGEEEDQQVHAPLLIKHNNISVDDICELRDEAIITTEVIKSDTDTLQETDDATPLALLVEQVEHEIKSREIFVDEDDEEDQENDGHQHHENRSYDRHRLVSSCSTPNISSSSRTSQENEGLIRKCGSYYHYQGSSPWKEIHMKHRREDSLSDHQSTYSNRSSSRSSLSSPIHSDVQWKSWFLGEQPDISVNEQSLVAPDEPIIFSQEFADEKVETDASMGDIYSICGNGQYGTQANTSRKNDQPFLMVRSESSISAFRPISNNLAPRCQQSSPAIFEEGYYKRSSSSYASSSEEDALTAFRQAPHHPLGRSSTLTKSKSFPTKSALANSINKSPPPKSHSKEHSNFVIRSIVNKKVSLTKLFGSRKSSASSSASSASHTTNTFNN